MCYPRRRFGQQRGAARLHLEHEGRQRGSKVVRFIPTQDTAIEFIRNYRGHSSPPLAINPAPLARHKPVIEELTKYLTQISTPGNTRITARTIRSRKMVSVLPTTTVSTVRFILHTHWDHTSKPASIPCQVVAFNRYSNNRQCICCIPKDRKQEQARRKPFASGLQVFDCGPSTAAPLLNGPLTYLWHPSSDLNMFSVRSQSFQPPTHGMTMHSSIRAPGLSIGVVCPAEEEGNPHPVFVH